jgi:uncharacterized protein YrrD
MMQFKEGTKVYTSDGKDVGHIDKVVMNPQTKELTHIVVRKGFLFTEDKILPVSLIASANEDGVKLREAAGNLDELPAFEETHYVSLDKIEREETDYSGNSVLYWLPPLGGWMGYPSIYPYPPPYSATTKQNIPENSVVLNEGTEVYSSNDKFLGHVERILTDSSSGKATYFVLAEGMMSSVKKLIPMSWVKRINENKLYLSVGKTMIERLVEHHPERQ